MPLWRRKGLEVRKGSSRRKRQRPKSGTRLESMGRGNGVKVFDIEEMMLDTMRGGEVEKIVTYDLLASPLSGATQKYLTYLINQIDKGQFREAFDTLEEYRDALGDTHQGLEQIITALTKSFLEQVASEKGKKVDEIFSKEEELEISRGITALFIKDTLSEETRDKTKGLIDTVFARFNIATQDIAPRNIDRAKELVARAKAGEIEESLQVLKENARYLKKENFTLLQDLLKGTMNGIVASSDKAIAEEIRKGKLILASLGAPRVIPSARSLEEGGLFGDLIGEMVSGMREEGDVDVTAQLKEKIRLFRLKELALYSSPGIIERGHEFFYNEWLSEAKLGRFLRKVYGPNMSEWPFPLAEDLAKALVSEEGYNDFSDEELNSAKSDILRNRALPRLIASFWPEALPAIKNELDTPTYSKSWKLSEEERAEMFLLLERSQQHLLAA